MKKLTDILKDIEIVKSTGSLDIEIIDVQFDSRKVCPGTVFFAVNGTQTDGHKYILQAIKSGAVAIVYQDEQEELTEGITYIQAANSAKALGMAASNFYMRPSEKMKLVGVTGTNGKTTIATLLYQMFKNLGYKVGLLSTIENYIHEEKIGATHTTPDPVQLNKLLNDMVDAGVDYCFMEVSSHAIHQDRIEGLDFAGGIFTNITHDHLDYHKTFSEYINVKKAFFDSLKSTAFALVNADDKNGAVMVQNTNAVIKKYSVSRMADFKAKILEPHFEGTLIQLDGKELWIQLIGLFNVYNVLAVYGAAIMLGVSEDEALQEISKLFTVNGRFQPMRSKEGKTAIVDYAHTPDALLNVLQTIKQIKADNQKVITVVGAGGNRDKEKRPEMAKIAADYSDTVILTSDNPRNENPDDIIADMQKGVKGVNHVLSITNRKEAIKTAVYLATDNDVVLVAGKGHETYQEIKGERHHFDDKEVLTEFLNNK